MTEIGRTMFGIGALIENVSTNKILVMKRSNHHSDFNQEKWELIYGRKMQFEDVETALRREVKEEIGLDDFSIIKVIRLWHFFRGERQADKEIIGVTFYCQTSMQDFVISDEHSEYRWVTQEEALELISVIGIRQDIQAYKEGTERLGLHLSNTASEVKYI